MLFRYEDEGVKKVMKRHSYINKQYREQEVSRKLETESIKIFKEYEDRIIR